MGWNWLVKTIIAGGRDIDSVAIVRQAIKSCPWSITEVVSGMAPGADTIGKQLSEQYGIPVKCFPADWKKHGKAAGPIRNGEMAAYAEALIAVWDGESRGTGDMLSQAHEAGLMCYTFHVYRDEEGNWKH